MIKLISWIVFSILVILYILNYYFHSYRSNEIKKLYFQVKNDIQDYNEKVYKNFESLNNIISFKELDFDFEKMVYSFKKIKPENILSKKIYNKIYDKN